MQHGLNTRKTNINITYWLPVTVGVNNSADRPVRMWTMILLLDHSSIYNASIRLLSLGIEKLINDCLHGCIFAACTKARNLYFFPNSQELRL